MKKYSIGGLRLSLGATVHEGRAGEPLLWFLKMAASLRALGRRTGAAVRRERGAGD